MDLKSDLVCEIVFRMRNIWAYRAGFEVREPPWALNGESLSTKLMFRAIASARAASVKETREQYFRGHFCAL